ncbi:MAG: uroporphyrinogen decarboxylase family protein [Halanaerobiales bacterium]
MQEMSSRERLINAIEGNEIDRIPFSPFLAYVWESFPESIQNKGELNFYNMVGADPLWRGSVCPVKCEIPELKEKTYEKGNKIIKETITPVGTMTSHHIRSEKGNTDFLVEHPLKNEEDYKIQLWIEEHKKYSRNYKEVREHLDNEGSQGLSLGMLFPRSKTAFQSMVEHYVGTEELIYALYDYPDTVETLHNQMMENDLKAAEMAVESPYDYFITWEDSSTTNYSPDMYKKYIGTEINQICSLLSEYDKSYIQHACGHVKDILPIMKENGVMAVESISPVPTGNITLKETRKIAGDNFGIIGGIEPTKFLNLPPVQLKEYVKKVLKDGSGGSFTLANSDSCPPGVTVEKFKLVAEVAKEYRI